MTLALSPRGDVVAELYREFHGLVPDATVHAFVRDAIVDLRGSIGREALAEMAFRLARVRLAALAESRAT